jgi:SAM-dependent methyltransferase
MAQPTTPTATGPSSAALDGVLANGRQLRPAAPGVLSAMAEDHPGAPYDRHARVYDRLIGNRAYNRLVWGVSASSYAKFAAEAVGAGQGLYLDAGCGTAVFTADVYRTASRPLVLVDLSVGMLERAASRMPEGRGALVQADLHDLPFAPGSFETIGCFAMLHVLEDPWTALAALRDYMAPGGALFASMLVTDRAVGRRYLTLIRRRGEVGPPHTADDFAAAAGKIFGAGAEVQRTGSMAWLRVRRS